MQDVIDLCVNRLAGQDAVCSYCMVRVGNINV